MRLAILILALECALPGAVQASDDEIATVARFALIRPEADPAFEEAQLSPGADWLRRPKRTKRKPASAGSKKVDKATAPREGDKSAAPVAPLRRERPKSETDPPTTRRRQLGW